MPSSHPIHRTPRVSNPHSSNLALYYSSTLLYTRPHPQLSCFCVVAPRGIGGIGGSSGSSTRRGEKREMGFGRLRVGVVVVVVVVVFVVVVKLDRMELRQTLESRILGLN
ncbi:hypothetical protein EX30DRAFT_343621 [Ascodesmis nigricans]|uniref:Uncharacterized protein n=1 Tax=Ascodesmis nigricans TaxID=341454 RepID=A0A4S2MRY1_9PEZI|nr:hypothetical protein EX30DRAFT_343621 [Ascodesmis nigricans]